MSKSAYSLFTALVLTGAPHALAASSVDFSVTGVITPSACAPSLSDGGVYDLGKIAARDLNADQPTPLAPHTLQLTISCEGPTLLALESRDNRPNSAYNPGTADFGLGLVNGDQKLGRMVLNLDLILDNGVRVYPIGKSGPSTWAPVSLLAPQFLTSFGPSPGITTPVPVHRVSADLRINPTIAPTNTLSLTEEVPIDGSMTLTMRYL